jgi:hypothetical protein
VNFREGQEVAMLFNHWGRRIERIATISRVTATLAFVGMMKFNRETGREHGRQHGPYSIIPATSEVVAEFEEQKRKAARIDFLRKYLDGNWRSMGDENLEKIAVALGFATEAK